VPASPRRFSREIAAFQSALADGPHVEIYRLTKLCALWHIDISGLCAGRQADLAMRFEVEVYAAAGDRLKSDPNSLRNLGENEKLRLCRRLSTYLSEQIGTAPPEAGIVEETIEHAIAGLSYREALLYRDWQDAVGDAMIERDPDSARRFRIIGYQKFTGLLNSDTPAPCGATGLQPGLDRLSADFAGALGAVSSAADESAYAGALEGLRTAFARIERSLASRPDDGPWFNGARYSLVDAGYAPFLQRWRIVETWAGVAELAAYPRLADWSVALVDRPSTHSFPPQEFEVLYRDNLVRRGGWLTSAVRP
jgi:glutathione S-transferase